MFYEAEGLITLQHFSEDMDIWSEKALKIREDPSLKDNFIKDNREFLLKSIYRVTGQYATEHDEEYSVALLAMDEALSSYSNTNVPFRAFAFVVIRRRLADFARREKRFENEIPASFEESAEEQEENRDNRDRQESAASYARTAAADKYSADERQRELVMEINEMTEILKDYGFSFYDIAEASPKSKRTKRACCDAVKCLLDPGDLYREMQKTRTIPMKELAERTGVMRKTLDRHRRYLIAAAEILGGDFPLLGDYLDYIRKELRG